MRQLKFCILAAAALISGAILVGTSLLVGSELIFLGFGFMVLGCLLPFAEQIAAYCKSFSKDDASDDRK